MLAFPIMHLLECIVVCKGPRPYFNGFDCLVQLLEHYKKNVMN